MTEFLRNTRELVVWEINSFEQVWDTAAHQEFKVSISTPLVVFITNFPPCCRLCWCPPSLTGWCCLARPGGTPRWARSGTGPGWRRTRAGSSSPTTPTLTQANRAEKRMSHQVPSPSNFVYLNVSVSLIDPDLFFPEVQERWGNQDEPEELHKYLIEEVS